MPTAINLGGNRSISITVSTIAKALASTLMKVRGAVRKCINITGISWIEAMSATTLDALIAICLIGLPRHAEGNAPLHMSPFCQRYATFITYDDMIQ